MRDERGCTGQCRAASAPMGRTLSRPPFAMMRTTHIAGHVRPIGIVGAVPQSAHALEPHAGIEEQPDDRGVATVAGVLARADSKQAPDLVLR